METETDLTTMKMVDNARNAARDALRAIKLGQFNDHNGLQRARGVIGELSGHVFDLSMEIHQLIVAVDEAKAEMEKRDTQNTSKATKPGKSETSGKKND